MKIDGNTILITGGATGIGFALAVDLVKKGNRVIICGRRENKLQEAKDKIPQILIKKCDVSHENERESLFNWVKDNFNELNILINNAGIQNAIDFNNGIADILKGGNEIKTNLASIYLTAHFVPFLLRQREAAIVNVTSGLAFVPIAAFPVYCATKAALHSFTQSLRYQLRGSSIKVFEIIPPMVNTDLGKGISGDSDDKSGGILPEEVATVALKSIEHNEYEIVIGDAKGMVEGSRKNPEKTFQDLNR
jgi:uncharacterized oxidoreductase